MKLVNLVNKRYAMLTVIKREGTNPSKHPTWQCLCDCGNLTVVTGSNLKSGGTKSCGCLKLNDGKAFNAIDIVGERYGKLTITSLNKREKGTAYWDCVCDCGGSNILPTGHLRSGHTQSCGCLVSETSRINAYKNLAGKKKVAPNGTLSKRIGLDRYIRIHDKEHPRSSGGFVLEHIKVMEEKIGRSLLGKENVHHINGDRGDNRPENLELWSTSQPPGQRVWEKAKHYIGFLNEYEFKFNEIGSQDLEKAIWYINRELEKRKRK
jgi:hypothetical protein